MDQVFGQERPRFLAASETDMFEGMPHWYQLSTVFISFSII